MIGNNSIDHLDIVHVEVLSRSASIIDRVNEDRWLIVESSEFPHLVAFAVIDGAGVRVKWPVLTKQLRERRLGSSSSAHVATLLKAYLSRLFLKQPNVVLSQALMSANTYVRESIENLVGSFDTEQLFLGLDEELAGNFRDIRLILPACVLTVARLNILTGQLEFAHLGDTVLLEFRHNSEVIRHTTDQMGQFDQLAFGKVLNLKNDLKLAHFRDAIMLPEGRRFIVESGLRLNYADVSGKIDRFKGCGVINGMKEMEGYIEAGFISVDPKITSGFALLTDGLELPSQLYEDDEARSERLLRMAKLIKDGGMRSLYDEIVRMTNEDAYFDLYPRTKIRDDATGIYIQFGATKRGTS